MGRRSKIQLRRGDDPTWASVDPVLSEGEPGYSTDEKYLKLGDGSSKWSELSAIKSYEVGDLMLATGSYVSGEVFGGVLRRVTSIQIPWSYNQTAAPIDPAIGTAVNVTWDVDLDDFTSFVGSKAATSSFGPRGTFNIEGRINYHRNQTKFGLSPISYADLHQVSNAPGENKTLTPSWAFMSSSWMIADGATVTLSETDVTSGGASFVDNVVYLTANGGTFDADTGTGTDIIGYLSTPLILGNVTLKRRKGAYIKDILAVPAIADDWEDMVENHLPSALEEVGLDTDPPYVGTVKEQYGIDIDPFTSGTEANIGIRNAAGTTEVGWDVTIDNADTELPINATTLNLSPDANYTLTSVPTIPSGQDGQRLTLINTSDTYFIKGQKEDTLTGSKLTKNFTLYPGRAITMVYSEDLDGWVNINDNSVDEQLKINASGIEWQLSALGTDAALAAYSPGDTKPKVSMLAIQSLALYGIAAGPGGSTDSDVSLVRQGTNIWRLGNNNKITNSAAPTDDEDLARKVYIDAPPVNAQTGTTYTLVLTDQGKVITLTNGSAITLTIPTNASVAYPVGTIIRLEQLGAGQVTVSPTGGVTMNSLSSANKISGQYGVAYLRKTATNTWLLSGDITT